MALWQADATLTAEPLVLCRVYVYVNGSSIPEQGDVAGSAGQPFAASGFGINATSLSGAASSSSSSGSSTYYLGGGIVLGTKSSRKVCLCVYVYVCVRVCVCVCVYMSGRGMARRRPGLQVPTQGCFDTSQKYGHSQQQRLCGPKLGASRAALAATACHRASSLRPLATRCTPRPHIQVTGRTPASLGEAPLEFILPGGGIVKGGVRRRDLLAARPAADLVDALAVVTVDGGGRTTVDDEETGGGGSSSDPGCVRQPTAAGSDCEGEDGVRRVVGCCSSTAADALDADGSSSGTDATPAADAGTASLADYGADGAYEDYATTAAAGTAEAAATTGGRRGARWRRRRGLLHQDDTAQPLAVVTSGAGAASSGTSRQLLAEMAEAEAQRGGLRRLLFTAPSQNTSVWSVDLGRSQVRTSCLACAREGACITTTAFALPFA